MFYIVKKTTDGEIDGVVWKTDTRIARFLRKEDAENYAIANKISNYTIVEI